MRTLLMLPMLWVSSLLTASAADFYVATNGVDTADGFGATSAMRTIQAAVNAASDGSTIHVGPGVYAPFATSNRVLTIVGEAGAASTVVDGGGTVCCAALQPAKLSKTDSENRRTLLRGFTLRNGYGTTSYGGGAYCGTLEDCVVTNCTANIGGGCYGSKLVRCLITHNTANSSSGGACGEAYDSTICYNTSAGSVGGFSGTAVRCRILHNLAQGMAGGRGGGGRGTFYSCIIAFNRVTSPQNSTYGGGVDNSKVYNCTIYGNVSRTFGGGISHSYIYNSICWMNSAVYEKGYDETYSCDRVEKCFGPDNGGTSANTGNWDVGMIDPENEDFRLKPDSFCRDAGNPLFVTNRLDDGYLDLDIRGKPRMQGEAPDVGAFEIQENERFVAPGVCGHGGLSPSGLYLSPGETQMVTVVLLAKRPFLGWATNGDDIVSTEMTWLYREDDPSHAGLRALFLTNFYVSATGSSTNNGYTAETPWRQINVNALYPGDVVHLGPGEYSCIYLANSRWTDITFRGAGADRTAIVGDSDNSCVRIRELGAKPYNRFYNLTLKNGCGGSLSGGGTCGGIYYDCIITNCTTDAYGGGAYGADLYRCRVIGCSSGYCGGGVYGGTIENCLVQGNTAKRGGGGCGNSSAYNCTIVHNASDASGNQVYQGTYRNCIIPDQHLSSPSCVSATLINCETNDPHFVSDLYCDWRLRADSPCVDAGSNELVTAETDLAGHPRIVGSAVDLGAFEGCVTGVVVESTVSGHGLFAPAYAVIKEGGEVVFTATPLDRAYLGWTTNGAPSPVVSPTCVWPYERGDGLITCHYETNRYVNASNGSDTADGGTSATALRTLPLAVNTAYSGEILHVAPGVYEGFDSASKVLRILSDEGPERTVIDGGNTNRCATMSTGAKRTRLEGFTLHRGYIAGGGGGVWGGEISRCIVTNNQGGSGGGVYSTRADNCLIADNTSSGYGGGANSSSLVHCTVAGNYAKSGGGGMSGGAATNSIVWGNRVQSGYADISGGAINAVCASNPCFVASAYRDWRIREFSPCIDAAVDVDAGALDLAGRPRIIGSAADLGAYEGGVSGAVVTVSVNGHGQCAEAGHCFVIPDGQPHTFRFEETLRPFLGWSTNGCDFVSTASEYVYTRDQGDAELTLSFGTNIYVNADSTATGPGGFTRESARRTLNEACALVESGDVILVAPGVYEPVTHTVETVARLIAEGDPQRCVIDGGGTNRCALSSYAYRSLAICGMTLANGRDSGDGGGGLYCDFYGCIFTNCTALWGGGAMRSTAESCLFVDCHANYGASAYDCSLIHCTMESDVAKCRLSCSLYGSLQNSSMSNSLALSDAGIVTPAIHDLRLRDFSPAIDAGLPSGFSWDRDAFGRPRVRGSAADLGALEGGVDVRVVTAGVSGYGRVLPSAVAVEPGGAASFAAIADLRPFVGWATNDLAIGQSSAELSLTDIQSDIALTALFATNIYVDAENGSDTAGGFTPETAVRTLSEGARRALARERVVAAPGVYEPLETTNGTIAIVGAGIGLSVIDGGNTSRCARLAAFTSSNSVMVGKTNTCLSGFTIRNGYQTSNYGYGAGTYGGTVTDCLYTNCTAVYGGGGSYYSALRRCRLVGNSSASRYGGGSYYGSAEDCVYEANSAGYSGGGCEDVTVRRCRFYGNRAKRYGGGVSNGLDSEYVVDCLFVGNAAQQYGGGACAKLCYGCTFVSNSAPVGAAFYGYKSSRGFVNCISWQNAGTDADPVAAEFGSGATNYVHYTCSATGVGDHGIAADPQFVNPARGDWRLLGDSPCVDAGCSNIVQQATDLMGNPRFQGAGVDLGAIEGAVYGLVIHLRTEGRGCVDDDWAFAPVGVETMLTARETVRPCLGWRRDDSTFIPCGPVWSLTPTESNGTIVATAVFSTNVYADASRPDDAGDGLTRATAKRTLAAAQEIAYEDESVVVLPGTYAAPGAMRPIGYIGEGGHSNVVVTGALAGMRDGTRASGFTFAGATVSGGAFSECLFNGATVSNATLTRCSVWGTAADSTLDRSLVWHDSQPSTFNLQLSNSYLADPIFADPEDGDFRVAVDSPCVSNGVAWCGVERVPAAYPQAPVVTPGDGTCFETNCTVTIAGDAPKARIWFTTNGRTPRLTDAYRFWDPFVVSNTVTIRAVQKVGRLRSPYAIVTLTRVRSDLRRGADCTNLVFMTSGDAEFACDDGDGLALKSGQIGANGRVTLATSVTGGGILSFAWSCDCERDPAGACSYDCLALYVDGERVAAIDGVTDWTNVTYRLRGKGTHAVTWVYSKDGYDDPLATFGDWGALRTVGWRTIGTLPELALDASADDLADALAPFADERVRNRILGLSDYGRLRNWALGVCAAKGIDEDSLVEHPRVWRSFALDQSDLLAAEPTTDDLRIDGFTPAGDTCRIVVSLDGLSIGDGATGEDLAGVFGLKGSTSLDSDGFSADNLEISLAEPVDGKAAFTIAPKGAPATFFIKTEVNP